jgi:hypothetical protein
LATLLIGSALALFSTMKLVLVVATFASLLGCASGGHGFVPPMRIDVAPVMMATTGKADSGVHTAVGLHWASLTPNPKTPIDIGIGYAFDTFVVERASETGKSSEPSTYVLHGPYLDIAQRVSGTRHKRMFVGGRLDVLYDDTSGRTGYGAMGRVAWELMAGIKGNDAIGTFAIGLFVESGYRKLPIGEYAFVGMGGLSLRLPLIAD